MGTQVVVLLLKIPFLKKAKMIHLLPLNISFSYPKDYVHT